MFPTRERDSWRRWRRGVYGVSLGQAQSAARLDALADWLTRQFDELLVLVGDGFHRFNILDDNPDLTDAAAGRCAYSAGEAFLSAATRPFLFAADRNRCRLRFRRVSDIQATERYRAWLEEVAANERLGEAVAAHAAEFSARRSRRRGGASADAGVVERSRAYLIEEIAVFAALVEAGWPVVAYPGALGLFAELTEGVHPSAPAPLRELRWLRLELRRRAG